MKVLCVGDVFVTNRMMEDGVKPFLNENDEIKCLFFGNESRIDMRDMVKNIEEMKRDIIDIPKELYEEISDCDILIVHLCPVTKKLLEKAKNLRAILSCRGGNENIDIDFATKKNIIVATNPAHNANAVAEYTIGLMICETRNIARAHLDLKKGIWRESFPNTECSIRELKDMTVGIIGFGSVGRLVAEKLSVFGCKIVIYDPYISESAYDFINFKFVTKDTLLKISDIISLHARATTPILDFDDFNLMEKKPYLINTARSILIRSEALKKALEDDKITGAAVDVFEQEPDIPEFYRIYDNLTITNHRGGDTINSYKDSPGFAIQNYLNYINGGKLKFWVNKDKLTKKSPN